MNKPTPAIVTQGAARRLPRLALLLFCVAYVVPGFVGREPWKNQDIAALGYMFELAQGNTSWLRPTLLGHSPEFDSLVPYWLGGWAMRLAPDWMAPDFAARIPFVALLALALAATWYAVYHLARGPGAQPVPFAFGGEAQPADYARAMADAGLLALIACLGLAQLSHETTPALAQLGFAALTFYGLAALPYRLALPAASIALGLAGMALSGAASMAMLFAAGGAAVLLLDHPADAQSRGTKWRWAALVALLAMLTAALASSLGVWRWRLDGVWAETHEWRSAGRLLLWFTWPVWPLALWTVWRWRRQLTRRHVALPLWFAGVAVAATLLMPTAPNRSLLLALPALAALAAFALPTFERSVSALIDWFTLLFFTGCAVVIWVVWISLQTGIPPKPAANVARLAPGFEPTFSFIAFAAALAGTIAWGWLVRWRTSRHRDAIWKSLVLPAGGTALCWLLLMTLWLPALDYGRSYAPLVRAIAQRMDVPGCVEVLGLTRAQVAALRFHGRMDLRLAGTGENCPWLLVERDTRASLGVLNAPQWRLDATIRRPTDRNENILLYRRAQPSPRTDPRR